MVVFSLFSWWYTTGWLTVIRKGGAVLNAVLTFFSVPLLVASLFAPFRQISAGRVNGPLAVQLRAWGDKTFSRVIGAVVRSILIVLGLVTLMITAFAWAIVCAAWPLLPFVPFIAIIVAGAGG